MTQTPIFRMIPTSRSLSSKLQPAWRRWWLSPQQLPLPLQPQPQPPQLLRPQVPQEPQVVPQVVPQESTTSSPLMMAVMNRKRQMKALKAPKALSRSMKVARKQNLAPKALSRSMKAARKRDLALKAAKPQAQKNLESQLNFRLNLAEPSPMA